MLLIDYRDDKQLCKITTDQVDNNWKQVRLCFSDVSDQPDIYEKSIELPWHSFISNLNLLADISSLYKIKIEWTFEAKKFLKESIESKNDLSTIDKKKSLSEEEIKEKLKLVGFKFESRDLTNEQIRNISKLSRLSIGATFSVPGAGKTTEAICFYLLHKFLL